MDWQRWMTSWDGQQEGYLPDREERFSTMLDVVDATRGSAPYVLDLACGLGSITDRVLERFPRARVVGLDIDPALLVLNRAAHDTDSRVTVVEANLSTPAWLQALADETFDAVLTATALHWLPAERVRRLYAEVSTVLRPEGVFCNADHMPSESSPLRSASGTTSLLGSVRPSHSPQRSTGRPGGRRSVLSRSSLRSSRDATNCSVTRATLPRRLTPSGICSHCVTAALSMLSWRRYDDAVVAGLR